MNKHQGNVWFEERGGEERRGEKWKGREKKGEEGNKEIKFQCLI